MDKTAQDGQLCAILSYLFPIGLIWYFADEKMKKNTFAAFHVKQSLVLAIFAIAISIIGSIIPIIGWWVILPVGSIVILILWVMGVIYAAQGLKKELWLIGQFGSKFTF